VQSLDWPADLAGVALVQRVYDRRSDEVWSYLALPPTQRREIREDMQLLAFDSFAEPIFDPDDPSTDASGWRQPDWRRDYYPTADGQGSSTRCFILWDKFNAHGRPVSCRGSAHTD
jgi:hypothetical protein